MRGENIPEKRGLGQRWTDRERFWRELNRTIHAAKIRGGVQTHKGLGYFKVGAMALFNGRKLLRGFRTVVRKRFDFGSIGYSQSQPLSTFGPSQFLELSHT